MIPTKNIFTKEKRNISDLIIHPIINKIGYLRPDDLYISDLKYFGTFKPVIITDANQYITLPEYIDAARQIGSDEIDVLVIKNTNDTDLLRLINFESRLNYQGNKVALFNIISILEWNLWNTASGRIWKDELPGNNINEKIGRLVGYKPSSISMIKYVGKINPKLLECIDDPESTLNFTQVNNMLQNKISDKEILKLSKPKLKTKQKIKKKKGKTYDGILKREVPKKNFIQELFYTALTGINSNAVVLLGPTPERIFTLLRKHILGIQNKTWSYEMNPVTLKAQVDDIADEDIILVKTNVINAYPERFMDIDLMCRWDNAQPVLKTLLEKQKNSFPNDKKAFLFSMSIMGETDTQYIALVKRIVKYLLDIEADVYEEIISFNDGENDLTIKKYKIIHNEIHNIKAYYYYDSSSMLTFSIEY